MSGATKQLINRREILNRGILSLAKFKSQNFVLKCRLEIPIKILYRGFAIEFQSKFHSEILPRGIPIRNLIVEFSVACQFSKRATKACYRLSFEISQWNSTPQIHNQNSVLNPAAKFYSRSGRIPEIPQHVLVCNEIWLR